MPPEPGAVGCLCDGLKSIFCSPGPATYRMFTASGDYALFFYANSHDPFPIATSNFFGSPGVMLLGSLGDAEQNKREPASGGRVSIGYWRVEENPWVCNGIRDLGAELNFFFVGERSASFVDERSPTIIRPFFDVDNRVESGFIVAAPGLANGGVDAHSQTHFWGGELNVWKNVCYDSPGTTFSASLMAGFRYLDLDSSLNINSISIFNQNLAAIPPFASFSGNTLRVFDSFAVRNRFYGGQVGIGGKIWPGDYGLTFDVAVKLALGASNEQLNINGGQLRTFANGTQAFSPAGVLALPTNIGNHSVNKFSQVPELDLKLSMPVLRHITLYSGFQMLSWTRLIRPALQIQRDIDVTQIPNFPFTNGAMPSGLAQPGVPFRQSDLLLLSVTFGMEVNW
jgi:hypothetical protein